MSINHTNNNIDDYSPAKTLIKFDNPIPLLRHPIKSNDSPILCFKNPKSFASSYISSESNITQQCESGARIACSVTASRNCAPTWWKTLIPNNNKGLSKQQQLIDREKCEEMEMKECLDSAKLSCRKFAEDKCLPAFRDARVLVESWDCDESVKKSVVGLIDNVCFWDKRWAKGYELGGDSWSDIRSRIGVRIVRGSDLLDKEFR